MRKFCAAAKLLKSQIRVHEVKARSKSKDKSLVLAQVLHGFFEKTHVTLFFLFAFAFKRNARTRVSKAKARVKKSLLREMPSPSFRFRSVKGALAIFNSRRS